MNSGDANRYVFQSCGDRACANAAFVGALKPGCMDCAMPDAANGGQAGFSRGD